MIWADLGNSDVALIENTAKVGGEIAVAYARLAQEGAANASIVR
jgi:hypothetical protein